MLVKSVTKFTLDMDKAIDRFRNKAIRNGDTSNIILSPLNLVNTLLVIHLGALGKTFEEIADVVGLKEKLYIAWKSELVHQIFGRLIENVCAHQVNSSDPLINTSTTIFSQVKHSLSSISTIIIIIVIKLTLVNYLLAIRNSEFGCMQ